MAITFLLAYCGGTVAAMACATASVGEGTTRFAKKFKDPDVIPRRLSAAASCLAIAIGLSFIVKTFLGM